jgi:hypothetical protein
MGEVGRYEGGKVEGLIRGIGVEKNAPQLLVAGHGIAPDMRYFKF